ncbi:hypothetical protein ACF1A5_11420 [Streptomyces sp. NPDC014864]|uniref:hypothetical protein n=1 Tax=Streptomyces sp. NPDC014864 TaxID=3364924 RepID=UPI0036FCDB8F
MSEYNAGTKVRYRNMAMPAEVLSGPHPSPGRDRYLIRKADGNVSLVPNTDLERIVPRLDQVAGTLAMHLYGRAYVNLDFTRRSQIVYAAAQALRIADSTRGQV